MAAERTAWYPVTITPCADRPGVYQTRSTARVTAPAVTFRWWLGYGWGRCYGTKEEASNNRALSIFQPTAIQWRGLMQEPPLPIRRIS